jgi:hypothetical protein
MAVFSYDAAGGAEFKKVLPIYAAAANLLKGAFIKWGTTDGTNRGFAIPTPVNSDLASEFIGILAQPFAGATLDNDPNAGTKYIGADCLVGPNHVYRTQYDTTLSGSNFATGLTMTTCSSTSIVVTSGESISGGWLFTDAGYLHYVLASSTGTYTLKSAVNAAETTSNKALKLGYVSMPKVTLKSTFEQISGGTAAQGAVQLSVLDIFIKAVGFDFVTLDPTKHDGLNLPISGSPQFFADVISTQHFMNHNA